MFFMFLLFGLSAAWTIWHTGEGARGTEGNESGADDIHSLWSFDLDYFSCDKQYHNQSLQGNLVATENKLDDATDQISDLKRWVDHL